MPGEGWRMYNIELQLESRWGKYKLYKWHKALPYRCWAGLTLNLQHATINGVVGTRNNMHDQAVYKQNKALPYGCRTCRTLNLQHATINGVVDTLRSTIYIEEEGGDYLVCDSSRGGDGIWSKRTNERWLQLVRETSWRNESSSVWRTVSMG